MCRLYLVNFVDMRDLKAGKFLRIRPTEIEFESNFSSVSQPTFLIAKKFNPLSRLNFRVISASLYFNS